MTLKKTAPIFLAFFVMGVADSMGPLSDAVQKQFELSNVMATLLPFFVFIAFADFSIPGGILAGRIGMKKLLLIGLGLNAVATLIPTVIAPEFVLLLSCIFVLGVGTTFLQVAGNPIMRDVSSEGAYSRNLSFAQGIKGVGSASSAYLVSGVIAGIAVFASMGWRAPFPFFFVLMVVAFVWVATMKIEEKKAETPPSFRSSLSLLKEPVFAFAVLGIFLYIGAEVSVARFSKPFFVGFGFTDDKAALYGPSAFFLLITIGRLLGGVVLHIISARTFFRISASLGLAAGVLFMFDVKILAIAGIVCAGLGFASIWPMLFSITVEERPERAAELSGLMCMAIAGGAIIPLFMGKIVDGTGNLALSFIVPTVCFIYLVVLSFKGGKKATV
ncbi:MFS transporter [candidate division KSB1 bacterium]|nr:MAG: MFS transporter [candidate division KSB1 bacterium]